MAEDTLNEFVLNLVSWIESLHEKNLKYEAQVETLSRDLAKAQNSYEQLEARLSAYQNSRNTNGYDTNCVKTSHDLISDNEPLHKVQINGSSSLMSDISNQTIVNGSNDQEMPSTHSQQILTSMPITTTATVHPQSSNQHNHMNHHPITSATTTTSLGNQLHALDHMHLQPAPLEQQVIYQPIASAPTFAAHQTPQYVWTTYDSSGQIHYYDQYGAPTTAFQQR